MSRIARAPEEPTRSIRIGVIDRVGVLPLPRPCAKVKSPARGKMFVQARPEELAVIRRAQHRDIEARNSLVVKHYPFICQQTKLALPPSQRLAWLEWVSFGVEGFIDAIMRFDPCRSGSLLTYSEPAVRRRVWRGMITNRGGAMRVPFIRPASDPSGERMAAAQRAMRIESIHASEARRHGVQISARMEAADSRMIREELADCLAALSEREERIVRLRLAGVTLREIGNQFGLTRERVRQLEKRAFAVLRAMMVGNFGIGRRSRMGAQAA